jgi:pentatricopeptide repeat protein
MKYNAQMGRLSRCLELRSQMLNNGLEASEVTFGILLEACVSKGDIDNARKFFKDLCASGLCVNVVHCTTFIKALIGANKLDEAAGVIHDMAKSSLVKPDIITYATLVKAYAESGKVASAMNTLQHMLDHGLQPDDIIFNAVLTSCSTFPLKAVSVMHTFEKLNSLGMRPTTSTLSILVKALAHSQSWVLALGIINTAHEKFGFAPEMRLYSQLAQACANARDFKVVLEVFEAMIRESQRQSAPVDTHTVSRFIHSCLSSGAPDTAAAIREAAECAGISLQPRGEKWLNNSLAKRTRP